MSRRTKWLISVRQGTKGRKTLMIERQGTGNTTETYRKSKKQGNKS